MIFHICRPDGELVGQFNEPDFRNEILREELQSYYYWCEGMTDWKPISEYKRPGRLTTIIENLPASKRVRAAAPSNTDDTLLKKLRKFLGIR